MQNHIEFISFLFCKWIAIVGDHSGKLEIAIGLDAWVFVEIVAYLQLYDVHTPVNGIFQRGFTFVNISRAVKCLDQLAISRFLAYS